MFASDLERDVLLGDVRVTIRRLSYVALERARQRKVMEALQLLRDLGGGLDRIPAQETGEPDPLAQYDWQVVLQEGVVRWTAPRPLGPEALADLDQPSAETLVRAILEHSLRPADEVKASASGSPPGPDRGEAAGLLS